jgi:hypothetical protein
METKNTSLLSGLSISDRKKILEDDKLLRMYCAELACQSQSKEPIIECSCIYNAITGKRFRHRPVSEE